MSLPEVLLWRELRKRPAGLKFRRQHPAGQFVLDFYSEAARLAIEVDGKAHDTDARSARDAERDRWLAQQGVRTLRLAATDVLEDLDSVLRLILEECNPLHQPSAGPPPLQGGF